MMTEKEDEEASSPRDGIGIQLRQLRNIRGLSLGALSDLSGVHKATLSRWESSVQRPGIPELEATLVALKAAPEIRQHILRLLGASGAPRALRLLREEVRGEQAHARQPSLLSTNLMPGGGSLLRALRTRRGWSQERAAVPLSLHPSTISRWERGEGWPEWEQLQQICALLGATAGEREALLTGQFGRGGEAADTGIDELEHRFRSILAPTNFTSELYPNLNLAFVALESSLWRHAALRPVVRPLLGEVYAYHANYLRNNQRHAEARSWAQKAIAIDDEASSKPMSDWAELAAVCDADAIANSGRFPSPKRAEAQLRWCLTHHQVSMSNRTWMLRRISGYQCNQERFADAIISLNAAALLVERSTREANPPALDTLETQRYMAGTLLAAGQTQEAFRWLPEAVVESYSVNRLRDTLLWAQAHQKLSHPAEAHEWVSRAYKEVDEFGLNHRRVDVDKIARLL